MPAETAKVKKIEGIDVKGKVKEDKEGDRDQVVVVGIDFLGGSMELDKILHAIENKVKVNVTFSSGVTIKDIYGFSCKTKVEEDTKLGTKWLMTSAQFEYLGTLAPMDKVLMDYVGRHPISVDFTMDQYVMVNVGSGEIKGEV